jgi:hypothetical protein
MTREETLVWAAEICGSVNTTQATEILPLIVRGDQRLRPAWRYTLWLSRRAENAQAKRQWMALAWIMRQELCRRQEVTNGSR